MATGRLRGVIRKLRKLSLSANSPTLTDGELLQLFISRRDESAFEALLRRHGPMVLATCRRLLVHTHDAEDAFQATFLILVRKATSIVPRDMVGNWLYGVACRAALKVKTAAARRRLKESNVPRREADHIVHLVELAVRHRVVDAAIFVGIANDGHAGEIVFERSGQGIDGRAYALALQFRAGWDGGVLELR